MTINQISALLAVFSKGLRDFKAGKSAIETRSFRPIQNRIQRRVLGNLTARGIGEIMRRMGGR